jgi:hypothetical protein
MSDTNGGTLTVYQRMSDPLVAVNELGTAIAKSLMFGCSSIDQGKVLALECLARGMPPLTLAERYHVVQGKLMMKYDAMLAEFHGMGGKHKIIERTENKAEIELTIDGQTYRESLTWEDAQKEKWPYKSDGKSLKDNWATPRARRQMLWARVVSEGVRALCPGVNNGRYVAEEIDDEGVTIEPAASNGNGQHKPQTQVSASVVDQAAAVASTTKAPPVGEIIDGSFEVVNDTAAEFVTDGQRQQIETLFAQLGLTADQQQKALAKRNASTVRNLTTAAAAELITTLESKLAAVKSQHEASLPELIPTGDKHAATCGPCTAAQEQRIKQAFAEWKQIDPTAYATALDGFKKKLVESGRQRILDLSANDAARLYDAVQVRKLDSFFRLNLEACEPPSKFVQSLADEQEKQKAQKSAA